MQLCTHIAGCVCVAIIQIVTDKVEIWEVYVAIIQIVTDKTKVIRNISTFMLNFGSYILYLLLLTIRYSAFGFTLDIKISMCYFTFTLLSLTSYALYLLLLTIHQFAFGFTLDIKIRKIIQSSVLSFPGVLKVVNFLFSFSFSVFLLLLDRNMLPRYSPPIMQGSFVYFSGCAYCIAQCWGKL